jgi:hypothetical protein
VGERRVQEARLVRRERGEHPGEPVLPEALHDELAQVDHRQALDLDLFHDHLLVQGPVSGAARGWMASEHVLRVSLPAARMGRVNGDFKYAVLDPGDALSPRAGAPGPAQGQAATDEQVRQRLLERRRGEGGGELPEAAVPRAGAAAILLAERRGEAPDGPLVATDWRCWRLGSCRWSSSSSASSRTWPAASTWASTARASTCR